MKTKVGGAADTAHKRPSAFGPPQIMPACKNTKDLQHINLPHLREELDELAGLYGSSGDVFFEIYRESFDRGSDYISNRIGSTNTSFENATDADKQNMMKVMAEVHRAEAQKSEAATDAFYFDDDGRRLINWEVLIDDLMFNFTFRTITDTEEILVYENGIYCDGRITIKSYLEEALGDMASLKVIREITAHIQRRTYMPRKAVNANKDFIPVQNGLINLDTMTLENFDSNLIYTFRIPVTYDVNAGYEHIEEFFNKILAPEDAVTMQEIFGYTLYPQQPAHKLFWWIGTGRNGKTTTSELLRAMIGAENDAGVPLAQLDGRHRFSVARLFGKLLNVVAEPETKTPLQTPTLKAASGGDLLHGELKGVQNVFPFWNFAKFIIFANDIPEIADSSFGFWHRTLVINFPTAFTGADAIKDYHKTVIKADGLAGLLNWALIGLKRLKDKDWEFTETQMQNAAKVGMQRKAQPVKAFVDDWTEFDNHIEMPKTVVYEGFKLYCDLHNIPALEERQFTPQLKQHANIRERQNTTLEGTRVRAWQGLRFKKGIVVLKTYIDNIEVSADEAIDAGVDNIKFEEVALLPYLSCTACTACTTFLHYNHVGGKRVIMENRAILPLYIAKYETPVHPVHPVQENEDSPENERNPKQSGLICTKCAEELKEAVSDE